jgi:N-acetylmuramoyl-L-alanine amidase
MFRLIIFFIFSFVAFGITVRAEEIDTSVMLRVHKETEIVAPIRAMSEQEKEDMLCLSLNVYHEARGSSILDKLSTAFVALNRLEQEYRGARNLCEVIWSQKQFSWTHDGKSDLPKEHEAWRESQFIAFMVTRASKFDLRDPTYGSTHYLRHELSSKVLWTKDFKRIARYGDHVYFRK